MGALTSAVTDTAFETEIEKSKGLVLVDFWAEWCGPCKMIAPVLEQVAGENAGKIAIRKLDVDDNPNTARRYGVMSIPTMILFKDGAPVERLMGYMPKERLMNKIRPHLG
ncbi:MAG TPA: thioredoxin [Thermoflexales bacterium]|jgi:thioredoxin 1|nr:thioredoxin [Anaerolineae bacterium]HQV27009.1 thioredoxin [Thermoflexales bacterium]HQX12025.1 thioredoxin [Thermoflexales bacterium]HQY26080.1 thioredoxin [Thermoflexales bacterium]HQZ54998.1 thioredoxin [Thermoflexales bacterium]